MLVRLRKLLPDSTKQGRHRRNILNIQITILAWVVECCGFFFIILGTFILGHQNPLVTHCLQAVSYVVLFTALPCIYLINDSERKVNIIESIWYQKILTLFNWQYVANDDEDIEYSRASRENEIEGGNDSMSRDIENDIKDIDSS